MNLDAQLTPRQTKIIKRLSEGATVKEIAFELRITEKTVGYHKVQAQLAIGSNSLAIVTRFALLTGLTTLRPAESAGPLAA